MRIDEVVAGIFKAPHSYTGEDVVEISCHGSPFVLKRVFELLIAHGVRPATPGEFTLRAFLNGKLDLSQAEAIADLIVSDSEAARKAAVNHMRGGFSKEIQSLRQQLIDFAALIELELDFSEEDVEFANREQLKKLITELTVHLTRLIQSFRLGNVIKQGVNVVIAGRPNAGKSTLLNCLLNEERAIVSDIPGTTRDTIEETMTIDGVLFRLIDTAGIRDAQDTIEKMGVEKTFKKISQSGIILYIFDASALSKDEVAFDLMKLKAGTTPVILVGNKTDLIQNEASINDFKTLGETVFISSKERKNLDALTHALTDKIKMQSWQSEDAIVTNTRHYDALLRARSALDDVMNSLAPGISGELLSLDIRRALDALGTITGQVVTDDLLDSIFTRFCIGK